MMKGLHALGWGLQRLGIVLGMTVFAALLTFATFVAVLIVIQAAASFGQ
jgi:hypothetical protein